MFGRVSGEMKTKSVAIVQPYVPEFRVPFFLGLEDELRQRGVILNLFIGVPIGEQAKRGDARDLPFTTRVPQIAFKFGSRSLFVRFLPKAALSADLLIVEQSIRNLESYFALLRRKPTAVWGHGQTITNRPWILQRPLHRWVIRRARWFFAYTDGSAKRGLELGARAEATTVLNNTIDVSKMVVDGGAAGISDDHGLDGRFVAFFLGGIDGTKRIDVLLDTAERIYRKNPSFLLVVAGDGAQRDLVLSREGEPWLRFVGYADSALKATLAERASLILMPGRVGLVAIDSFALGLPIVTLASSQHAPEFEYLDESNSLVVDGGPEELASAVIDMMASPSQVERLQVGAVASVERYPLTNMITRFADGVSSALRFPTSS